MCKARYKMYVSLFYLFFSFFFFFMVAKLTFAFKIIVAFSNNDKIQMWNVETQLVSTFAIVKI